MFCTIKVSTDEGINWSGYTDTRTTSWGNMGGNPDVVNISGEYWVCGFDRPTMDSNCTSRMIHFNPTTFAHIGDIERPWGDKTNEGGNSDLRRGYFYDELLVATDNNDAMFSRLRVLDVGDDGYAPPIVYRSLGYSAIHRLQRMRRA
jgi:hypothetical protein